MKEETILKYLNNTCSEAELLEVLHWLNSDNSDELLKEISKSEWLLVTENNADFNSENYNVLLNKIHHIINIRNKRNRLHVKSFNKGNRALLYLVNLAAILFIPLFVIFLYTQLHTIYNGKNFSGFTVDSLEIISPAGSQTVVYLTDGSSIYFNHDQYNNYKFLINMYGLKQKRLMKLTKTFTKRIINEHSNETIWVNFNLNI